MKKITILLLTISLLVVGCGNSTATNSTNSNTQKQETLQDNSKLIFDGTKMKEYSREDMNKFLKYEGTKADCYLNKYEYQGTTEVEYDKNDKCIVADIDISDLKYTDPEKALKELFNVDISEANALENKLNTVYTGVEHFDNMIMVLYSENKKNKIITTIKLLPYSQQECAKLSNEAMSY